MNHIVKIRISSNDWDRTVSQCEWDEIPPTPVCFVPLIRVYKEIKGLGLGDAKRAIEETIGREPRYGEFTFVLDDADLGRLYLFLRNGNHIANKQSGHIAGYEVTEILTNRQGGIIV